jgi:diaminopimelate epimerase
MQPIPFYKYQGAGNDLSLLMIVKNYSSRYKAHPAACDRKYGI